MNDASRTERRATRISRLRIDGFGKLQQLDVSLKPGLNVVFGENEAGKSTLLRFVTSVIFGFAKRKSVERMEPVGATAYGGEVHLDSPLGPVIVRRHASRKRVDGEVLVRDASGTPRDLSDAARAVGNVSRELFDQVFSLSLDELHAFSSLAQSEVGEALVAAGMQGAKRLPETLEVLRTARSQLFLPRGKKRINQLLAELNQVRRELAEQGDRVAAWRQAMASKERAEVLRDELDAQLSDVEASVAMLQRVAGVRAQADRLRLLDASLVDRAPLGNQHGAAQLGHSEMGGEASAGGSPLHVERPAHAFEEDTTVQSERRRAPSAPFEGAAVRSVDHRTLVTDEVIAAFEQACAAADRAQAEVERLVAQLSGLEAAAMAQAFTETQRSRLETCTRLLNEGEALRIERTSLQASERAVLADKKTVLDALAALPIDGAPQAWLDRSQFSATAVEELQRLRGRSLELRGALISVSTTAAVSRDRVERAHREVAELEASLAAFAPVDEREVLARLEACRAAPLAERDLHAAAARVQQVEAALREVTPPSPPTASLPWWTPMLFGAALTVMVLAAWGLGLPAVVLVSLLLVIPLSVAAFRLHAGAEAREREYQAELERRKTLRQSLEVQLHGARTECGALEQNVRELRGRAPGQSVAELERLLEQARARRALEPRCADAVAALQAAKAQEQRDRSVVADLTAETDQLQTAFDERLVRLGFSAGTDVEVGAELVRKALDLRQSWLKHLVTLEELKHRRTRVTEWEKTLLRVDRELRHDTLNHDRDALSPQRSNGEAETSLSSADPSIEDVSSADVAAAEHRLMRWVRRAEAQRAHADALVARVAQVSEEHRAASVMVARAQEQLSEVCAAHGMAHVEMFRAALDEHASQKALVRERAQCTAQLEALGVAISALPQSPGEWEELDGQLTERIARVASLKERSRELVALSGRLGAEIDQLTTGTEAAVLRSREEQLIAQISEAAQAYVDDAIAERVLLEAKERHELSSQPRVIRRAEALFRTLTGGAYEQLRSVQQAAQLLVRDQQGHEWDSAQLSRGTREMLLLSLRLAVAEDFGETNVALPMLLDDVLVNIDDVRAARVAEVLRAFALRHQIVLMTCHKQTVQRLSKVGAEVVTLTQPKQLTLLSP